MHTYVRFRGTDNFPKHSSRTKRAKVCPRAVCELSIFRGLQFLVQGVLSALCILVERRKFPSEKYKRHPTHVRNHTGNIWNLTAHILLAETVAYLVSDILIGREVCPSRGLDTWNAGRWGGKPIFRISDCRVVLHCGYCLYSLNSERRGFAKLIVARTLMYPQSDSNVNNVISSEILALN